MGREICGGPGRGIAPRGLSGGSRAISVTRANAAEEEAMSALEGSGVAMEIASESSARARVPAGGISLG